MGSSTWAAVLERDQESVRVPAMGVTASFFDTLGVRAALGRTLVATDDAPNAEPVVVLSDAVWRRRFGADPSVVGTRVTINDRLHEVVGIMPEGFAFPRGAELWMPVVPVLAAAGVRTKTDGLAAVGVLFFLGRLRESVSIHAASSELSTLGSRFGDDVAMTPLETFYFGPVQSALWILFAAVGVLLLIACANVSGLMVARASRLRAEQAVRLALGATPARMGREWIWETVRLSVAGGILGLVLARWGISAIVALGPDDVPRMSEVSLNVQVAAFTLAASVLTALLCGLGPLRQARRLNVAEALAEASRGASNRQLHATHRLLLVGQITLAFVLLIAAGLLVRSLGHLRDLDLGFAPDRVLTMNVSTRTPPAARNEWLYDLVAGISTIPGVESAGAVSLRPLVLGPIGDDVRALVEGQNDTPETRAVSPSFNRLVATPDYFRTMQIQLKAGRFFDLRDDARAPHVAILSEGAARRLWPGVNPLGRRFAIVAGPRTPDSPLWTVVGVVGDARYRGITDLRLDIYEAARQSATAVDDLVIRTTGDPLAVVAAVQARARALDPRVVIDGVTTMDAIVGRAMAPWRLSAWMLTVFAAIAFALSAAGLFSVASLHVIDRRREFAVRLALGAAPRHIVREVLQTAAGWVGAGVALGTVAAVVGAGLLKGLLFGVGRLDGVTYASVLAIVLGAVVLATLWPAAQASRVDPLELLRRQ
jgi:predicted permease